MALGNSNWRKYGKNCTQCGTTKKLTRHHLKNLDGKRTGKIVVLCRSCHDDAEKEYNALGIINNGYHKLTPNEKLHLDYMNGRLPFYSVGVK